MAHLYRSRTGLLDLCDELADEGWSILWGWVVWISLLLAVRVGCCVALRLLGGNEQFEVHTFILDVCVCNLTWRLCVTLLDVCTHIACSAMRSQLTRKKEDKYETQDKDVLETDNAQIFQNPQSSISCWNPGTTNTPYSWKFEKRLFHRSSVTKKSISVFIDVRNWRCSWMLEQDLQLILMLM